MGGERGVCPPYFEQKETITDERKAVSAPPLFLFAFVFVKNSVSKIS